MQVALLRNSNAITIRSAVALSTALADGERASWIQICKVGQFKNYVRGGKKKTLAITKAMLTEMETNFNTGRHPEQPTQLLVDYEHLSANPQHPEDGKAAGWFRQLELREEGAELWARVEWTEPAALSIEKKEFKYFSPEFTFEYTTHEGDSIGTALLAGALTNRPFLQGMAAVALRSGDPSERLNTALMYEQRRMLVQAELRRKYAAAEDDECSFDRAWVCDMDDAFVIYELEGKKYRGTYQIASSGEVTLGDAEEVITTYTPLASGDPALADRGADPMKNEKKPDTIRLRNSEGTEIDVLASAIEETQIVKDLRVELASRPAKADHDKVLAENVALAGRLDRVEAEQKVTSERLRGEEADREVTNLISTGKASAGQKPSLVKLYLSDKGLYDEVVANAAPVVQTGEIGAAAGGDVTASARVMTKIAALQKDNTKLSQAEAMDQVFASEPALYAEYTAESAQPAGKR